MGYNGANYWEAWRLVEPGGAAACAIRAEIEKHSTQDVGPTLMVAAARTAITRLHEMLGENSPNVELARLRFDLNAANERVRVLEGALERVSKYPQVYSLAVAMTDKLDKNAHKGGWSKCRTDWLTERAVVEVEELRQAAQYGGDILGEAADVANFAMMIADNNCAFDAALDAAKEGEDGELR